MIALKDTNGAPLEAGKWYAIGFLSLEDEFEWGSAMIYKYEGNDVWVDDNGSVIADTLDPHTQTRVHPSDADAFARQA